VLSPEQEPSPNSARQLLLPEGVAAACCAQMMKTSHETVARAADQAKG